jgi:hypothetical protein
LFSVFDSTSATTPARISAGADFLLAATLAASSGLPNSLPAASITFSPAAKSLPNTPVLQHQENVYYFEGAGGGVFEKHKRN